MRVLQQIACKNPMKLVRTVLQKICQGSLSAIDISINTITYFIGETTVWCYTKSQQVYPFYCKFSLEVIAKKCKKHATVIVM